MVLAVRPIHHGRIRPEEVADGPDVPVAGGGADGGDVGVGISGSAADGEARGG